MNPDDDFHAQVWAACEAFRGEMPFVQSRDYVLTLVFLKYISDVWHNLQAQVQAELAQAGGQAPAPSDERINRAMSRSRFYLPQVALHDASGEIVIDQFLADIYSLNIRREHPDIGAFIDRTLAALEKDNPARLYNLFFHVRFDTYAVLSSGTERNLRLRHFLSFLAFLEMRANMPAWPALFLFLIERFSLEDDSTPETPRQIARLLHHLVKPRPGEQVADPVCASASLLLASSTHGVPLVLFGQEAVPALLAIARMNLLVHEQDDAIMKQGDCLRMPQLLQGAQLQQFDVVLAYPAQDNMPWLPVRAAQDAYRRFWRGLPPRHRVDYAYICHCLAMTRPGCGRLAIIATQGMLFRGRAENGIRQQLIEENLLDTVILLPPNVLPHSRVGMVVCLFDRAREAGGARAHVRDVLMIDASVGIAPNKHLCLMSASQIDQIIADVNARQTQGQGCYLASTDEIAANEFDLTLPRYQFAHKKALACNLQEARQQIAELEQALLALQNKMTQQLATLDS